MKAHDDKTQTAPALIRLANGEILHKSPVAGCLGNKNLTR